MEVEEPESGDHSGAGNFDLVAVHGLYSTSSEAWGSTISGTWLKQKLGENGLASAGRVLIYNYADGPPTVGKICTRQAIQREAFRLLTQVSELRKGQDPPLPLVFVAIDIGGILVKEALVQASMHGVEFASIKASTRLLAFIYCPHRWKDPQDLESRITRFVLSKNERPFKPREAKRLASTIASVTCSFLQTGMLTRATVVSLYATESTSALSHQFTATLDTPMELRCEVGPDEDLMGEALFKTMKKGLDRVTEFPWRDDGFSPLIDSIESQAAPVYPPRTHFSTMHPFSWLDKNAAFQNWLNCYGCSILHVYGSPSVSQAGEYAFHKCSSIMHPVDGGKEVTLYFQFHQHDARRNSVAAMTATFLTQILGRFRVPPLASATYEPPLFSQSLTGEDIFFLLNSIRIQSGPRIYMTWILDGLDNCDPTSSHWLLSQLLDIASSSEMYFKVLITTLDNKRIRETLADAKCLEISLKSSGQGVEDPGDNAALADILYLELLQERPEFESCSTKIQNLLAACEPDVHFARIMRDWLVATRCATKGAMEEELKILSPPSPERLFARVLDAVPQTMRPWARKFILWISHALRPLSPQEFVSALSADSSPLDPPDITSWIRETLGPLFVVEAGELRFSQPSVRSFIESADLATHWYALPPQGEAHREITRACIRHLRLPETLERISEACRAPSRDSRILLASGHDFTSYAIQYWPNHHRLGYMTDDKVSMPADIVDFFRDEKALQCWFAANWHLSLPHLRASRSTLQCLPILSYLGLVKEAGEVIASLDSGTERESLLAAALCEAARKGHEDLVDHILSLPDTIPLNSILSTMEAVACSGQYDILKRLLSYLRGKHEAASYPWPHVVLCRLSWAGMDGLLKDFVRSSADNSDLQGPPELPSKLYCAAARGHAGAATVLLNSGENPDFQDSSRDHQAPIHIAAKYGYGAVIRVLADAGAAVDPEDSLGRTPLVGAAVLGHHRAVSALLDVGADIKKTECPRPHFGGWPAVVTMARDSNERTIGLLIGYGVDVNTQGPESETSLSWTVRYEHLISLTRLLLEHSAKANGSEECRPLVKAVESRSPEMLGLLLDRGADVDAVHNGMGTAIEVAAKQNLKDIVTFLLENGANVDSDSSGGTAVYWAARAGYVDIVRVLIAAGADVNRPSETSWAPIHAAHAQAECLGLLLDAGAEVDASSKDSTALYLAAYHGKLDGVELLMSRGANLEVTCEFPNMADSNFTPLLAAALQGHEEVARALLKGGANVKAKAPNKKTALHLAITASSEPLLKVLLEYNPELDAKDGDGMTALHRAIYKSLSLVEALVHRGADLEIRDTCGCTSLGLASLGGHTEVAKYLISAKAKINVVGGWRGGPLHHACHAQDLDMLKLLIEKGGDVSLVDPVYGTPLQLTLRRRRDDPAGDEFIRYLVDEAGADVTGPGGYLGSALHVACLYDTPEFLKTFLDRDIDANVADFLDRLPIHHATFRTVKHVEQLLSSGADIRAKDRLGRTILHTAVTSGRLDVVQKVLSMTSGLVNEPDLDGWTPLHWALRKCDHWGIVSTDRAAIIQLLIDEGADVLATGHCCHEEWSPLRLSRLYGLSREIISLLTPKMKTTADQGRKQAWSAKSHHSRTAKSYNGYCDACLHVSFARFLLHRLHALSFCVCY
ncbi:ankyrin repeat-containing domain protein [Chaetomium sp. MPI-CAGE-AT-0009]|nr:ankyrin repeat-containing domain protein [Chaetomium sp. MPI-CAGE-AT-0009]